MAQLMVTRSDDPNAHNDGAPTPVDGAPALVPVTAPVDTSAAVGGDAAAAREAFKFTTINGIMIPDSDDGVSSLGARATGGARGNFGQAYDT